MEIMVLTLILLLYFVMEAIYRDYFSYREQNIIPLHKIEKFLEEKRPQIENICEHLSKNFQCPQCGFQDLATDIVSVSGKEYSQLSREKPHKFIKASCTHCGLTSFYNLNRRWGLDELDPLPLDEPVYEKFMDMADHFTCPECYGKKGFAKSVTIRKKDWRHLLGLTASEWVCLCCDHCGWSSFFDTESIKAEPKYGILKVQT
ncbi:MAG: hypothetical protein HYS08_02125 [Chlamydiae bacterium]|nr:hypothetical protein [Chlamydiota bacterium]MBI3266672.1 hypothetical protein [Chlamydiota bacterium]